MELGRRGHDADGRYSELGREICAADTEIDGAVMIFQPTHIAGVWIIRIEPHQDERGFFARTVCVDEFRRHGLNGNFVQHSISWNPRRGTLRGLHYQRPPYEEGKLIRCTQGALFDVAVDIRRGSLTYGQWFSTVISADNREAVYLSPGIAHGFQTLVDDTQVEYAITVAFQPDASTGIAWNDEVLKIPWPAPNQAIVSPRDKELPTFRTSDVC